MPGSKYACTNAYSPPQYDFETHFMLPNLDKLQIHKRQLEFLGHNVRKRDLEHLALIEILECRSSRGHQRSTFLDNLLDIIPDIRKTDPKHLVEYKGGLKVHGSQFLQQILHSKMKTKKQN